MTRLKLARSLSPSLTHGAWDAVTLRAQLRRRLPAPLHRYVAEITAHLMADLPALYAPSAARVARSLLLSAGFMRFALNMRCGRTLT